MDIAMDGSDHEQTPDAGEGGGRDDYPLDIKYEAGGRGERDGLGW